MNREQRRLLNKKNKNNPLLDSLNKPSKYKIKKEKLLFKDGEEVYLNIEPIRSHHKNGMNEKYKEFVEENIDKPLYVKYIDYGYMIGGTFGLQECDFYFHSTELLNKKNRKEKQNGTKRNS